MGRRLLAGVVAGLLAPAGLAACGGTPSLPASTPVLHVVTGLFPLAQAVAQIGQGKVQVTDVVPAGDDPLTYRPTADQTAAVQAAGLVVEVGGGFQPPFEAAAAHSPEVLDLNTAQPSQSGYFWLDSNEMQTAVGEIAAAMEHANPEAAPLYRDSEQAYAQEVQSTGIDYENTLTSCPRQTIFTADDAFASMAKAYSLHDDVVGTTADPTSNAVSAAAAAVSGAGATTVFSEPWVDSGTVVAVASAAGAKIRILDTLAGAPSTGWPAHATYIELMESDLGALSSALGCPNTETES